MAGPKTARMGAPLLFLLLFFGEACRGAPFSLEFPPSSLPASSFWPSGATLGPGGSAALPLNITEFALLRYSPARPFFSTSSGGNATLIDPQSAPTFPRRDVVNEPPLSAQNSDFAASYGPVSPRVPGAHVVSPVSVAVSVLEGVPVNFVWGNLSLSSGQLGTGCAGWAAELLRFVRVDALSACGSSGGQPGFWEPYARSPSANAWWIPVDTRSSPGANTSTAPPVSSRWDSSRNRWIVSVSPFSNQSAPVLLDPGAVSVVLPSRSCVASAASDNPEDFVAEVAFRVWLPDLPEVHALLNLAVNSSTNASAACAPLPQVSGEVRDACSSRGWLWSRDSPGTCSCGFGRAGKWCSTTVLGTDARELDSPFFDGSTEANISWPTGIRFGAQRGSLTAREPQIFSFAPTGAFWSPWDLSVPRSFVDARVSIGVSESTPGVCDALRISLQLAAVCDNSKSPAVPFDGRCFPNTAEDPHLLPELQIRASQGRVGQWLQFPQPSLSLSGSSGAVDATSCGCDDWRNATYFVTLWTAPNTTVSGLAAGSSCALTLHVDFDPACPLGCGADGACSSFASRAENGILVSSVCDCNQPISGKAGSLCCFFRPFFKAQTCSRAPSISIFFPDFFSLSGLDCFIDSPQPEDDPELAERLEIASFGSGKLDLFSESSGALSDLKSLQFVGEQIYHRLPQQGTIKFAFRQCSFAHAGSLTCCFFFFLFHRQARPWLLLATSFDISGWRWARPTLS
jgi:hypothetical protein